MDKLALELNVQKVNLLFELFTKSFYFNPDVGLVWRFS